VSVEFWFAADEDYNENTSYVSLVKNDDLEVYISDGNMVFERSGYSAISTTYTWNAEEWHHIAAIDDTASLELYIDGVLENSIILDRPFTVQNSSGDNVASFLSSGDILLAGSCIASSNCIAPVDDAIIFEDSGGDTVAYIDANGNLCVEDADCNDNDETCDPGDGSFIVEDTDGNTVSSIDPTGELCLIGDLVENTNP
jgi:hypothetical protein